jgi:hypothetical protein
MPKTTPEQNKALVLEAFDTLFNKRDYEAAARFWSDTLRRSREITILCSAKVTQHHAMAGGAFARWQGRLPPSKSHGEPSGTASPVTDRLSTALRRTEQVTRLRRG